VWLHYRGQTGPCRALELQQVASSVETFGEEMGPQKSLDQEIKIIAWLILQGRGRLQCEGKTPPGFWN